MPSEHPTLNLGELPRLAVRRPDGREVHHWLATREITIGRGLSNRICIPDPHVSKLHAKITFSDDSITLADLGSTNRTRVNGNEVSEAFVKYGDFIQIAHVECRLLPPQIYSDTARNRLPAPPLPPPGLHRRVSARPTRVEKPNTVDLPAPKAAVASVGVPTSTRLPQGSAEVKK